MAIGLPVSRLINVGVNLSPQAAQFANFNALLLVGDSDVIDVGERIRSYGTLAQVAADFGTAAPEYAAAALFFSQIPQPNQLYVGRWARTATHGLLRGGVLGADQSKLSIWTAIANGGFNITVDGVVKPVSGLNFSAALNLNGVAAIITAALTGATVTWTGEQFVVTSTSTGATSTVSYATAPATGTDISAMLGLTAATASPPVAGIGAETALDCVALLDDLATSWYGLMFVSPEIADEDHLAVAAYVQAAGSPHIYGVSTTDSRVLGSTVTDDIASRLKAAGYSRCFCQYSEAPHAAASFFGRAFTVDFAANNAAITMMFKQEPGVVPENLTQSQADTLRDKRCNVFVRYDNRTAILQDGVMSGPAFFDEIHGIDWLRNRIQTDVWNLLYTSPTKIPQTDAGTHMIVTTIEAACAAGVNNGLMAPGVWNSAGFGTLSQGDFLPKGYHVHAPLIATQAQADREARKSVPIQVAAKLAGAIHSADIMINVNR